MISMIVDYLKKLNTCRRNKWDLRLVLCDIELDKIPRSTILIHPYAITISPVTKLGENCIIRQCVTIGSRNLGVTEYPVLGNNVYVGANALILGNLKIGNNVIIGAGSIVLKDVPGNTTVIGVWK